MAHGGVHGRGIEKRESRLLQAARQDGVVAIGINAQLDEEVPGADQISRIAHRIYAGITFLKGFTETFANTPEVARIGARPRFAPLRGIQIRPRFRLPENPARAGIGAIDCGMLAPLKNQSALILQCLDAFKMLKGELPSSFSQTIWYVLALYRVRASYFFILIFFQYIYPAPVPCATMNTSISPHKIQTA